MDLQDVVEVNEEQASTTFLHQVTEIEGEQDADMQSHYLPKYGNESRTSSHWIGFKDDDVAVMECWNEATVG